MGPHEPGTGKSWAEGGFQEDVSATILLYSAPPNLDDIDGQSRRRALTPQEDPLLAQYSRTETQRRESSEGPETMGKRLAGLPRLGDLAIVRWIQK